MNGVWIVGYLVNEGNDGNHLYTKIDVFQNREDMESKLMKNGWSLEEINNCIVERCAKLKT